MLFHISNTKNTEQCSPSGNALGRQSGARAKASSGSRLATQNRRCICNCPLTLVPLRPLEALPHVPRRQCAVRDKVRHTSATGWSPPTPHFARHCRPVRPDRHRAFSRALSEAGVLPAHVSLARGTPGSSVSSDALACKLPRSRRRHATHAHAQAQAQAQAHAMRSPPPAPLAQARSKSGKRRSDGQCP